MRRWKTVVSWVLLPALAACVPGVAEYTKTEAPTALRVDGSHNMVMLIFGPGSDRLAAGQVRRLAQLVQNGEIHPADRVEIAAAGGRSLAQGRFAAISRELLRYGIVADTRPIAGVPPNRAVILIGHYAVTLPPCPNWSQSAATDFTNEPSSNFGCADAINLGMTVANPADLSDGRTLGAANGKTAVGAVDRYLTDQVIPPVVAQVGVIATPTSGTPPAAASGNAN
jgi:pilus assembly protein CpaD